MRILINALSGIGDALMFSPVLALIKKHYPQSIIDMLVMFPAVKELYSNNPHLNEIIYIDFLNQSKLSSLKQTRALKKNKYDVSINVYPSNRKEYNGVQFTEGAKKRAATRYLNYSKGNFDFLNNVLVNEVKDRHNVIENFELAKAVLPELNENEPGALEIYLNESDINKAVNFIQSLGLSNKLLVGFHAGSATFKGHINKRWSALKYAELAKLLNEKYGAQIMLFGTEKDVNLEIKNNSGDYVIIPETKSLTESLALMKMCRLFVSNDSALMHIAAGLKIPQAAIFGYTNYKELYPWQNRHIIVRRELDCSPCFFNSPKPVKCIFTGSEEFKCIRKIEVDEVFDACVKLIEEKK